MSDEAPYGTPFGMIEYYLTVTTQLLIDKQVLGLHRMSIRLSELADEAPPALAIKLRELAAVAAEQCDELDGLLEVL
jgi:hypothetical protein